jgi:hypothetical protein
MAKQIVQMRRGTTDEWANHDMIVPLDGEIVIEIDNESNLHKLKIGDGIHKLAELPFMDTYNKVSVETKYQYEDEEEVLKIEF